MQTVPYHKRRLANFWALVVEESVSRVAGISPCWVFIGGDCDGYGRYSTVLAHRLAAAIYCAAMPSKVYSRCGNRKCVRREHLYIAPMSQRRPKVSKLTGKTIDPPMWKQPEMIAKVLEARCKVPHSKMAEIARVCGTNKLTVKKILMDAPIHDAVTEVLHHKSRGVEYRQEPYLKQATLDKHTKQRYDLIFSNRSNHAS